MAPRVGSAWVLSAVPVLPTTRYKKLSRRWAGADQKTSARLQAASTLLNVAQRNNGVLGSQQVFALKTLANAASCLGSAPGTRWLPLTLSDQHSGPAKLFLSDVFWTNCATARCRLTIVNLASIIRYTPGKSLASTVMNCVMCGSNDVRKSRYGSYERTAERIARTLQLRRWYRCRSCGHRFLDFTFRMLLEGESSSKTKAPNPQGPRK